MVSSDKKVIKKSVEIDTMCHMLKLKKTETKHCYKDENRLKAVVLKVLTVCYIFIL
jgi:hypothetical protein